MRRTLLIALLAVACALPACGDDATGPPQPIDGTWQIEGVYSELDYEARCRLTGQVSLQAVGGGVNTLNGDGTWTLDCLLYNGDRETLQDSVALDRGSLTGSNLRFFLSDCDFGGTYDENRPNTIRGGSVCNVAFSQTGNVAPIGSWEAFRVSP